MWGRAYGAITSLGTEGFDAVLLDLLLLNRWYRGCPINKTYYVETRMVEMLTAFTVEAASDEDTSLEKAKGLLTMRYLYGKASSRVKLDRCTGRRVLFIWRERKEDTTKLKSKKEIWAKEKAARTWEKAMKGKIRTTVPLKDFVVLFDYGENKAVVINCYGKGVHAPRSAAQDELWHKIHGDFLWKHLGDIFDLHGERADGSRPRLAEAEDITMHYVELETKVSPEAVGETLFTESNRGVAAKRHVWRDVIRNRTGAVPQKPEEGDEQAGQRSAQLPSCHSAQDDYVCLRVVHRSQRSA